MVPLGPGLIRLASLLLHRKNRIIPPTSITYVARAKGLGWVSAVKTAASGPAGVMKSDSKVWRNSGLGSKELITTAFPEVPAKTAWTVFDSAFTKFANKQ